MSKPTKNQIERADLYAAIRGDGPRRQAFLSLVMSLDEAREWAEEELSPLMERCHECGHRLSRLASHCPQCHAQAAFPWQEPKSYPEKCDCERCAEARDE